MTRDYTFKRHQLSEAEQLWLQEVVQGGVDFSIRTARIKLHGKLPADFNPRTIDHRICGSHGLKPIGLWLTQRDHPLLKHADLVIRSVRERIIADPALIRIAATELAGQIEELTPDDVGRAFAFIMDHFHGFFSAGGGGGRGKYELVEVDESTLDAYFGYLNMDDLLEKYYIDYDPARARSAHFDMSTLDYALDAEAADPVKPDTAFVLMAMDPERPDLTDVYEAIKDVCQEYGIAAYRSDTIQHQDRITDVILREIRTAEHLIADLTHERPNVYYEIGYAHALRKKPILYRKKGTRLHFDLSVHNVPEYPNVTELKRLLRERLEAILGRKATSTDGS